jgi:hypothetical protein
MGCQYSTCRSVSSEKRQCTDPGADERDDSAPRFRCTRRGYSANEGEDFSSVLKPEAVATIVVARAATGLDLCGLGSRA